MVLSKWFVKFKCFWVIIFLMVFFSLVYVEMYLVLVVIVYRFDWGMFEIGLDDVICYYDFFVVVVNLESKGVRVIFVKR